MDTQKITENIASLRRAMKSVASGSTKDKIKAKIDHLKQVLKDSGIPTKKLAIMLLGAKRRIQGYSAQEFNSIIKRLAERSEYSFLKSLTKAEIKDDLERGAKKPGWRFKGNSSKTPTKADIKAGKNVYYENRSNRSDVVKPVLLNTGGTADSAENNSDPIIGGTMASSMKYGGPVSPKVTKIKEFLDRFPNNATSWAKATDELPELHNDIAEYVEDYRGNIYKSKGGTLPDDVRSSPSRRNTVHKKAILRILNNMPQHEIDSFYEDHKDWFESPTMKTGGVMKTSGRISHARKILNEIETNTKSLKRGMDSKKFSDIELKNLLLLAKNFGTKDELKTAKEYESKYKKQGNIYIGDLFKDVRILNNRLMNRLEDKLWKEFVSNIDKDYVHSINNGFNKMKTGGATKGNLPPMIKYIKEKNESVKQKDFIDWYTELNKKREESEHINWEDIYYGFRWNWGDLTQPKRKELAIEAGISPELAKKLAYRFQDTSDLYLYYKDLGYDNEIPKAANKIKNYLTKYGIVREGSGSAFPKMMMKTGGPVNDLVGKRIRLIDMPDDPNPIKKGEEGTVDHIDGAGHIHVKWDSGRSLSLLPGVDEYEVIYRKGGSIPNRKITLVDEVNMMPKEQFERISAEINSIKLEDGGGINAILNKHLQIDTICKKHNCTKDAFFTAQMKHGGNIANGWTDDYVKWERAVTDELCDLMEIDNSDAQGVVEANEGLMSESWGKGLSPKKTAELIKGKKKTGGLIIENEKSNKYYNPNQPKYFVAQVVTTASEDDDEDFDDNSLFIDEVGIYCFDKDGNDTPGSFENQQKDLTNKFEGKSINTIKKYLIKTYGKESKEGNKIIDSDSDRLSSYGGYPKTINYIFDMPKFEFKETKKTGGPIGQNTCETFDEKGERMIDPKSIEKLTACTESQEQTKDQNLTSDGTYTPERQALHKKIINEFKKDVVCIRKGKPIAVLMGGAPASGKSTFLKKYRPYLLAEGIFKVDADEIRAELPEYAGWNATATHEETGDIVNTLISNRNIGVPCLFDFIYDGTMTNFKKYDALVTMLKGLGYEVFIVFISNIPKETLVTRAMGRYKTSGRFVPVRVIDDFLERGEKSMNALKEKVDGYIVVDGSTFDYSIVEEGGKRLPNDRIYKELGEKVKLKTGGAITDTLKEKWLKKVKSSSSIWDNDDDWFDAAFDLAYDDSKIKNEDTRIEKARETAYKLMELSNHPYQMKTGGSVSFTKDDLRNYIQDLNEDNYTEFIEDYVDDPNDANEVENWISNITQPELDKIGIKVKLKAGGATKGKDLFDIVWSIKNTRKGVVKIPKTFTEKEVKAEIEHFNNTNNEWTIADDELDETEDKKYWIIYGWDQTKMKTGGSVNTPAFDLLEEMVNDDIIDEEHPFYNDSKAALVAKDDTKIKEIIQEMLDSDIITKGDGFYKQAKTVVKIKKETGGNIGWKHRKK